MQHVLSRPVAVLTGSSSGFGMLTALALAQEGYQVVATMRDPDKGAALQQEARSRGMENRIDMRKLDVTNEQQIHAVVENVRSDYGRLDVLVNNAGYALGGMAEEVPLEKWRHQFETNFFGMVAMTQAVLPQMRSQRRGHIINVSSISGRIGLPGYAPYASSKFAMEGFSESLRLELLPYGIHVVLIEPGAYQTDIWNKGFATIVKNPTSPYTEQLQTILSHSRKTAETASDPREVADSIVRAARSPYPRLRYAMGKGARLTLAAKSILPWKWLEQTVRRMLT